MRKTLLFFALAASFVAASFLIFANRKGSKTNPPSEEEIVLFDEEDQEVVRRDFVPLPFSQEELQGPSEYRVGYSRGYIAFLSQQGLPLPPPEQIVQYTSLVDDDDVKNPEEENKGYTDGYHRASESLSCPACKTY